MFDSAGAAAQVIEQDLAHDAPAEAGGRSTAPADAPPSTLTTGSSTQAMLDIADLLRGMPDERRPVVRARLARLLGAVLAFATGCKNQVLMIVEGNDGYSVQNSLFVLSGLLGREHIFCTGCRSWPFAGKKLMALSAFAMSAPLGERSSPELL